MAKQIFHDTRERFKTLAENRTNNVLRAIRILSNCSNKNLYDFKDDEVDKIFIAIQKALDEARVKFKKKEIDRFRL